MKLTKFELLVFQPGGSVYSELEPSSGCWAHERQPLSSCKYRSIKQKNCVLLPLFTLLQRCTNVTFVWFWHPRPRPLSLSQPSPSQQINLGPSSNPSAKPSDFHFLKVIGKGSFGKVLLARHRTDDQFYAVKVLQKKAILKKKEVNGTRVQGQTKTWTSSFHVSCCLIDMSHPPLFVLRRKNTSCQRGMCCWRMSSTRSWWDCTTLSKQRTNSTSSWTTSMAERWVRKEIGSRDERAEGRLRKGRGGGGGLRWVKEEGETPAASSGITMRQRQTEGISCHDKL